MKKILRIIIVTILCFTTVYYILKNTPAAGYKTIYFPDYLGVNVPILTYYMDSEIFDRQLALLEDLGLEWIRLDAHWYHLEPKENQFNLKEFDGAMQTIFSHQLKPLVYFVGSPTFVTTDPLKQSDQWPPKDMSLYANRLYQLAEKYPQVPYWQIWNEPNISAFWMPKENTAEYGHMLHSVYDTFHKNGISHKLVIGGMAYYSQMPMHKQSLMLKELADAGIAKSIPIAAYHPYTNEPEGDGSLNESNNFMNRAALLNNYLRSQGVREIWATEFGWSTYAGAVEVQPLISEEIQADYLLKRLVLMMSLDFNRIFWFSLSDMNEMVSERDQHYGLLRKNGEPKPAFLSLQYFLKLSGSTLYFKEQIQPLKLSEDTFFYTWERKDGTKLIIFWGKKKQTISMPSLHKAILHNPINKTQEKIESQSALPVPVLETIQILEIPN